MDEDQIREMVKDIVGWQDAHTEIDFGEWLLSAKDPAKLPTK